MQDGGGRPFRFFNYMVQHAQFAQVVQDTWRNDQTGGASMNKVWGKLKTVKAAIKTLHVVDLKKKVNEARLMKYSLNLTFT